MNYTLEDENADDLDIARELVRAGWKGTSNKHRRIARLPEGKSGLEALQDCAPDAYRRIMERAEQQAADEYRRIHANDSEGTAQTLDMDMWGAFKKAGGEASF